MRREKKIHHCELCRRPIATSRNQRYCGQCRPLIRFHERLSRTLEEIKDDDSKKELQIFTDGMLEPPL